MRLGEYCDDQVGSEAASKKVREEKYLDSSTVCGVTIIGFILGQKYRRI